MDINPIPNAFVQIIAGRLQYQFQKANGHGETRLAGEQPNSGRHGYQGGSPPTDGLCQRPAGWSHLAHG